MAEHPTLTLTAWDATPDQAEAIFEAAMSAASDAAGPVVIDGVAVLSPQSGDTAEETP